MKLCECDDIWISMHREAKHKTEVQVGILFTSKKKLGGGRGAIKSKVAMKKIVKTAKKGRHRC